MTGLYIWLKAYKTFSLPVLFRIHLIHLNILYLPLRLNPSEVLRVLLCITFFKQIFSISYNSSHGIIFPLLSPGCTLKSHTHTCSHCCTCHLYSVCWWISSPQISRRTCETTHSCRKLYERCDTVWWEVGCLLCCSHLF